MVDINEKTESVVGVDGLKSDPNDTHTQTGLSVVEQGHTIPTTGERKTTTRREYWAFCLYNWGGTGVGLSNYAGALQQNLVQTAFPNGFLNWGGQETSTNSFILDLNGIAFAVQLVVLLLIGPYADYGSWRPRILIFWTIVGVACSFAFLGFTNPDKWAIASGFFVLGNVALTATGTFYIAAFPGIVRDLPQVQESEREVIQGIKSPKEHAKLDMIERSNLSNLSYIFSGGLSALSIILGLAICYSIGYQTSEQNNKVYSVICGYFGAIWVLSSIPWFFLEQYRPGQKLPDNANWLTVGFKQVWEAARNVRHLKQTFLYIAAYFLIHDGASTSSVIVNIQQNNAIQFDTVTYTGLFAVVYGSTTIAIFLSMKFQQKFGISPKWMFFANAVSATLPSLWGMVGNWTTTIGYRHVWEFWLFQVWSGFMVPGFQSYSATVMAEVSPAPKMYIFFALFNVLGTTSGFVGPYVSAAIVDDANGNNNAAYYFTFFTGATGCVMLWFLDLDKAKQDNAKYLEREREELYASYGTSEILAAVPHRVASRSA